MRVAENIAIMREYAVQWHTILDLSVKEFTPPFFVLRRSMRFILQIQVNLPRYEQP